MKQTIKNYSFNAAAHTITFSDFSSISLERVYLITNVTTNTLIYQFNNPSLGGSASTNVLTLTFNTGSMSNTDKLQIIYDAGVGDPDYDNTVNIQGVGGGTPVPISGTVTTTPGGTQTVSGTVTANAGTNLNTSLLALESGGNLASIASTNTTLAGTVSSSKVNVNISSGNISNFALETGGNLASIATTNTTLAGTVSGGKVNVNLSSGSLPAGANTIGNVEITDGTNTANVLKSDGTAAGQNAQLVAGTYLSASFTTTSAQAVASTDAGNYTWVSVHITGQGTSSNVAFQASNDNSNWTNSPVLQSNQGGGASTINSTGITGIFHGPLVGRYFRLNVTGISAGTTAGVVYFQTAPRMLQSVGVQAGQTGTWNVGSSTATGSAVPTNAFYIGMNGNGNLQALTSMNSGGDNGAGLDMLRTGTFVFNGTNYDRTRSASSAAATTGTGLLGAGVLGIYNSSAPTITSGNYERIQLDVNGNVKDTLATLIAGEDLTANVMKVELRYSYASITTATTTTVKSGAGFIHTLTILGGTAGAITVYDNTAGSGTTICPTFTPGSVSVPVTITLDVSFGTGLTIVTGAATVLTVSYR